MIAPLPATDPDIPSLEERNGIVYHLRLQLARLCLTNDVWVANGRGYLAKREDGTFCMDNKTGEKLIIMWQGQPFTIKSTATQGSFEIIDKSGNKSKIFNGALLMTIDSDTLLQELSEGSIKGGKIGDKGVHVHFIREGDSFKKKVILCQRKKGESPLIYPYAITLMAKEGYKFSYGENEHDFSFQDKANGQIWHPNFSDAKENKIMRRHGKEYIEAYCVTFGEGSRPNQQKELLLSRADGNSKFTKHYLSCGQTKIAVSHLIGPSSAEIIFGGQRWTVKLNEQNGELIMKQGRYMEVSSPSTFWYDLETGTRLDHEPAEAA